MGEIRIKGPNFQKAIFKCKGMTPLVIHRFSHKTMLQMLAKQEGGKAASSKKNREAKDSNEVFNGARYISPEGWDGIQASCIRNAAISACRLVNFKMTLAKMSIFVIADGRDKTEPEIPLIRVYGKPRRLDMMARVETGQPYVTIRPCWDEWEIRPQIRWDADQFSAEDICNLLMRVGQQVGIGEGRPDSKNSAGLEWGLFEIVPQK